MAQAYTPIQDALDAQLETVSGITSYNQTTAAGNFISENETIDLVDVINTTGTVFVRSTLVPAGPETETIGSGGYDKVSGIYAIDLMGPLDKGYTMTKQLADVVIAAFPRGTVFTLANSEQITVETTGMAPNITQGAWEMNKLYCVQVQVKWYGYMAP